jgi:hypothetical protein
MFGSDLAKQLEKDNEGTALGDAAATRSGSECGCQRLRISPPRATALAVERAYSYATSSRTFRREKTFPQHRAMDFEDLIAKAQGQHDVLERERVAAGKRALSGEGAS